MPYPVENPSAKHDFLALSEDELSGNVFDTLDRPIDPKHLTKRAIVYSYPDGPLSPGPLSRSLTVIGILQASHPIVQKLLDPVGGGMSQCTVGVKRYQDNLPEKDKSNCLNFAKFITKLIRAESVALLGKDKFGRFGILKPMKDDEKFAAECYVGDAENARALFQGGHDKINGSASNANTSDTGMWQPPGGGDLDGDADGGLWQPPGDGDQADAVDFSNHEETENSWNTTKTETPTVTHMEESSTTDTSKKGITNDMKSSSFHKDIGAATADKFYSCLKRTLDTRSESQLYHMRAFNGWVKATQIQELNPQTLQGSRKRKGTHNAPLRVLDLAWYEFAREGIYKELDSC
jgi:hypothetical protein